MLGSLWFNSFSSGGGGAAAYELISTTVLPDSTSASVTFTVSSYSATYKHLQIRYTGRCTGATDYANVGIRFNSDTGSNYAAHYLIGNGSSVSSGATTTSNISYTPWIPGANKSANVFGASVVDILDAYSTSKNKTFRALGGFAENGVIGLESGLWMSTSALTSITMSAASGNFVTGTRFSLYGLRA